MLVRGLHERIFACHKRKYSLVSDDSEFHEGNLHNYIFGPEEPWLVFA